MMGEAVVKKKQIIEQALDEGITDIHELAMLADTTLNAASVTKSAWKKKRERMAAEESGKTDGIVAPEGWPEAPGGNTGDRGKGGRMAAGSGQENRKEEKEDRENRENRKSGHAR